RNKQYKESIIEIIEQHKRRLSIEDPRVLWYRSVDVSYCSYVFNENEKVSHWKNFLIPQLTEGHNFNVKKMSFVLFCHYRRRIFAIVGGSGMRVIKKFLNDRFGLDLYERLMDVNEDVVISHVSRGILGNLSENRKVYRIDKKL